jgi:thiamine-monophosphate kinase
MLTASGLAGDIQAEQLPISAALQASALRQGWPSHQPALLALSGGEDYELCFCAPPAQATAIDELASRLGERLTRIGSVRTGQGLVLNSSNRELPALLQAARFDHFGA